MKKQINRMKQLGNQALGRAEKTEVLSEDLLECERKVDNIKHACQSTTKKLKDCLMGSGTDVEKRQRKMPYTTLAMSMQESAESLGEESVFGTMLGWGSEACFQIAAELTSHEMGLEGVIMSPFTDILENHVPRVTASRKRLNKLILDLDSCKARYQEKQSQKSQGPDHYAKLEAIKDELDEANQKVAQCKDQLSNEMMALVSKESDLANSLIDMVKGQAQYHRSALARLEVLIPKMNVDMDRRSRPAVYGEPLEEHLQVEGRKIALPLETGAIWLMELGLDEEGLFRIAGSTSKVKILTNAYNTRIDLDMGEFLGHEHAVAGALKQYLRELPEPLLTYDLYDDFQRTQSIPDRGQRLQALWTAVYKLPEPNFENFKYLVRFLQLVSTRSDKNKMTASNLALVIGPNIMRSKAEEEGVSAASMGVASSVLESFIVNADYFFPNEPPFDPSVGTIVSAKSTNEVQPLVPNGETKAAAPLTIPISTGMTSPSKPLQTNVTAVDGRPVPTESKPKRPACRKPTKRKAPGAPQKSPHQSPSPSPHNSLKRSSGSDLYPLGSQETLQKLEEDQEENKEIGKDQEQSDSDEAASPNSENDQKEENANPFLTSDNDEEVPSIQEDEFQSQPQSIPEAPVEKPNRPHQQPPKPGRPDKPPIKDKPEKPAAREKPVRPTDKPPQKLSKPTIPPPIPKNLPKRDSNYENYPLPSSQNKTETEPASPQDVLSPKATKLRPKIVPPPPPSSEGAKEENLPTPEPDVDEEENFDFHKNESNHETLL